MLGGQTHLPISMTRADSGCTVIVWLSLLEGYISYVRTIQSLLVVLHIPTTLYLLRGIETINGCQPRIVLS